MQTFNRTVGEACDEVVGKALEKPRAWRGYFAKGAGVVKRAMSEVNDVMSPKYYALKDRSLMETEESSHSWLTRWTALKHYYSSGPAKPPTVMRDMKWEYFAERERLRRPDIPDWDDYSNVAYECIKKQDGHGQGIMYGRSLSCEWQPLTSFEHCWFDDEPIMCESRLCNFFDYCDDGTNISHRNAMSMRRLGIMESLYDDTDDMRLWTTSGKSSISSSKQWEMNDGQVLQALAVTLLIIVTVHQIVRRTFAL